MLRNFATSIMGAFLAVVLCYALEGALDDVSVAGVAAWVGGGAGLAAVLTMAVT